MSLISGVSTAAGSISGGASAITALSGLIVVSPNANVGFQPQNAQQKNGEKQQKLPALYFAYEGENRLDLESDITDHFVEDNTTLQDQIALKPETVTTEGFIGELTDLPPDSPLEGLNSVASAAFEALRIATQKLTTIVAYTPELTATALIAYNKARLLYAVAAQTANSSVAAVKSLSGKAVQNKQQLAFTQFYGYWRDRTLFTVQTPWAVFEDMAIKSIQTIQDEDTRMVTSFRVTFKRIRFATTITEQLSISNYEGRASNQAATEVDLGVSTPKNATETQADELSRIA